MLGQGCFVEDCTTDVLTQTDCYRQYAARRLTIGLNILHMNRTQSLPTVLVVHPQKRFFPWLIESIVSCIKPLRKGSLRAI
jgi:hypothetical protein